MSSPIEKIFEDIFGSLPSKSGAAYERLAAIAMHLLDEGSVMHDVRLRGQFSDTLYQLDVHHQSKDGGTTMGEAKDYSERGSKVGRGDLQKLGGALPDIQEIDAGIFFSATGYTKPAKKYAEAADKITGGKQINLYELAASTDDDEKGFVKTIVINMHAIIPHAELGEFKAVFTTQGEALLKQHLLKEGDTSVTLSYGLSEFHNSDGAVILSLAELTSKGYGEVDTETNCASACYWLPRHHILVHGLLTPIQGLEYTVPFSSMHREIVISDDSTHRLVIRDKDGTALRILTDKNIREFTFDADGNVVKR